MELLCLVPLLINVIVMKTNKLLVESGVKVSVK